MDNGIKPLSIEMAFAWDSNRNGKIEPEEVVNGFSGLDKYDGDGDRKLKGTELEGVYYEIGKDKWAPAGRFYYDRTEFGECRYNLKEIDLKNRSIQLDIDCSYYA